MSDIEQRMQRIWCDILQCSIIDSEQKTFFELGGNSLTAILLLSKIEEEFYCEISLNDIYGCSTFQDAVMIVKEREKTVSV